MRVIQALDAGATVSDKWPNHVWSPKATFNAIAKSTTFIKLTSSKDEVAVHIHRELLCFFSSYYHAALKGTFLEARKDTFGVDLSGESLKGFESWIYTGYFHILPESKESLYINLYIFADQMDIMALRRSTVSNLADLNIINWDLVKLIVTNVAENSPLRMHVLDTFIAHWMPRKDRGKSCVFSRVFDPDDMVSNSMYEVLKGVALRKSPPNGGTKCPCCSDLCKYHEHECEEERKETCGQIEDAKLSYFAL